MTSDLMTGLRARLIVRLLAGLGDAGFVAGLVLVEFRELVVALCASQK
jgi:hypothetical protein